MSIGYQRIVLIIISLAIQVALLAGILWALPGLASLIISVASFMSFVVIIAIMVTDMQPEFKLPWMIAIGISPILATIIYLVYASNVGNNLGKRAALFVDVERQANEAITFPIATASQRYPAYAKQIHYLHNIAGASVHTDTAVTYFPLGEDMWTDMLEHLKRAEHTIYMEYFIVESGIMWDAIADILRERAQAGVEVRFMFDSLGSLFTAPKDPFETTASRAGGQGAKAITALQVKAFNDRISLFSGAFNHRDHRKLCIIDDKVAYTGGVNLADEYINQRERFGHWKDTALRVDGPAAQAMGIMTEMMWDIANDRPVPTLEEVTGRHEHHGGEGDAGVHVDEGEAAQAGGAQGGGARDAGAPQGLVIPYTDYPTDDQNVGETAYLNMITAAQRYVYITTPYLIISTQMVSALATAAKNGVDVRIIVPGIPDKQLVFLLTRSYYHVLVSAGVKVYEYTPGFVHAKQCLVDDEAAIVGTINLDYRSLTHHFENAVFMVDVPAIQAIKDDFDAMIEVSQYISLAQSRPKGLVAAVMLPLLKIFAPLL